jgi:nitrite reductase/ring-hydroxylating ferredoxin subunit
LLSDLGFNGNLPLTGFILYDDTTSITHARRNAFLTPADRLPLCKESEVAPGEMVRVQPEGRDPILVCNVAGTFYAVDDECTHAIASLSEGRLVGNIVFCPMHGGSFDVCSGEAQSLPCKQPLRTWPLEVADGKVYLLLRGQI